MTLPHGTQASYRRGCRCGLCTEAKREYQRRHRAGIANEVNWTHELLTRYADKTRPPFDLTEAACVGLWGVMFPTIPAGAHSSHDAVVTAKAVCIGCPLIEPCRDWAVANREVQGVWGGVWFGSSKERAAARRAAS